jgi:hypothetical protein
VIAVTERVRSIRETQGDWLFHYTTLETAVVYILPTLKVRLNPFSSMRDPREYTRWSVPVAGFTGDASDVDVDQAWAAADARLNALKDEFKLLSMTMDDPANEEGEYGRGYARSRLWEAYAGRGGGVCLTFDKSTAIASISEQLKRVGRSENGPVTYRNDELFREIFVDLGDALKGDVNRIADEKLATHMKALFLTKNAEWESEREYRFIVQSELPYVEVDVSDSLMGVCLGPETPKDAFYAIRYFAREADIAIGKLLWWNNRPLLVGIARD